MKSEPSPLLPRRQALKQFALGAVGLSFSGKLSRRSFLAEMEAATPDISGAIRISLQEFPTLLNELGSIRLGINPIGPDQFPDGDFYPILVNRGAGNSFFALSSQCLHQNCVVESFDEFEQGLACPCHGSLYGIDGQLIRGPSTRDLKTYPIEFDGQDLLTIRVPGLNFSLTPSLGLQGEGRRFRLRFPTFTSVSYEVRFRARLTDEWQVVPFALTPQGEVDQWAWIGFEGGAEVFVERQTRSGFYSVAIQLLAL